MLREKQHKSDYSNTFSPFKQSQLTNKIMHTENTPLLVSVYLFIFICTGSSY